MKSVARYGVRAGRYKSTLGSNFHLCVSRFKFNQWAFFDGCVNVDNVIIDSTVFHLQMNCALA